MPETTLVDVTVRVHVADHERDYVRSGSQAKETAAAAAMRMIRNGYLDRDESVISAEEVRSSCRM